MELKTKIKFISDCLAHDLNYIDIGKLLGGISKQRVHALVVKYKIAVKRKVEREKGLIWAEKELKRLEKEG